MFVFSCKTIHVNQESQSKTTQLLTLGSIGLDKHFVLKSEFNNSAIPKYSTPLKVSVIPVPFCKKTYKAFKKAQALQAPNFSINYIDSLKKKPRYIKLSIADKVGLISALNNTENHNIKKYLSHNDTANVLTNISISFNQNDLNTIASADAVFLIEKGLKNYVLQLYTNGVKTQTLAFNQGIVFAYSTSNCCWQENERHQLNIVDLTIATKNCPNKTYKSAKRAEKKTKTFNY